MPLFLLKYWKYILLAAIIAGIAVYHYHLTSTIASQKIEIVQLKDQVAILDDKIKVQNDAVDKLKTDSDTRIAAGLVAQKQAEARSASNKKRAAELSATLAKYPADLCRSANELIDGELK
jgi:hypothetical protein